MCSTVLQGSTTQALPASQSALSSKRSGSGSTAQVACDEWHHQARGVQLQCLCVLMGKVARTPCCAAATEGAALQCADMSRVNTGNLIATRRAVAKPDVCRHAALVPHSSQCAGMRPLGTRQTLAIGRPCTRAHCLRHPAPRLTRMLKHVQCLSARQLGSRTTCGCFADGYLPNESIQPIKHMGSTRRPCPQMHHVACCLNQPDHLSIQLQAPPTPQAHSLHRLLPTPQATSHLTAARIPGMRRHPRAAMGATACLGPPTARARRGRGRARSSPAARRRAGGCCSARAPCAWRSAPPAARSRLQGMWAAHRAQRSGRRGGAR